MSFSFQTLFLLVAILFSNSMIHAVEWSEKSSNSVTPENTISPVSESSFPEKNSTNDVSFPNFNSNFFTQNTASSVNSRKQAVVPDQSEKYQTYEILIQNLQNRLDSQNIESVGLIRENDDLKTKSNEYEFLLGKYESSIKEQKRLIDQLEFENKENNLTLQNQTQRYQKELREISEDYHSKYTQTAEEYDRKYKDSREEQQEIIRLIQEQFQQELNKKIQPLQQTNQEKELAIQRYDERMQEKFREIKKYKESIQQFTDLQKKGIVELQNRKARIDELGAEFLRLNETYRQSESKNKSLEDRVFLNQDRLKNMSKLNREYEIKIQNLIAKQLPISDLIKEKIKFLKEKKQAILKIKDVYAKKADRYYQKYKIQAKRVLSLLELALQEYSLKKESAENDFDINSLTKLSELSNQINEIENEIEGLSLQMDFDLKQSDATYASFQQEIDSQVKDWKLKKDVYLLSHNSSKSEIKNESSDAKVNLQENLNNLLNEKIFSLGESETRVNEIKQTTLVRNQKREKIFIDFKKEKKLILQSLGIELKNIETLVLNQEKLLLKNLQDSKSFHESKMISLSEAINILNQEKKAFQVSYESRKNAMSILKKSSGTNLESYLRAKNQFQQAANQQITVLEVDTNSDGGGEIQNNLSNSLLQDEGGLRKTHNQLVSSIDNELEALEIAKYSFLKSQNEKKQKILNEIKSRNIKFEEKIINFSDKKDKEIERLIALKQEINLKRKETLKNLSNKKISLNKEYPISYSEQFSQELRELNLGILNLKREISSIEINNNKQENLLMKQEAEQIRNLDSEKNKFLLKVETVLVQLSTKKKQSSIQYKSRVNKLNLDYKSRINKLSLKKQDLEREVEQIKVQDNLAKLSSIALYEDIGQDLQKDFINYQKFSEEIFDIHNNAKKKYDINYTKLIADIENKIVVFGSFLQVKNLDNNISEFINFSEKEFSIYQPPKLINSLLDNQINFSDNGISIDENLIKLPDNESQKVNSNAENADFITKDQDTSIVLIDSKYSEKSSKSSWFGSALKDTSDPWVEITFPCSVGACDDLEAQVSRYEVTNVEFKKFDPEHVSGNFLGYSLDADEQPAVNVTFNKVVNYIRWLNSKAESGSYYRLLTEKEWVYLGLSGLSNENELPWYQNPKIICQIGNVADASLKEKTPKWITFLCDDGAFTTQNVGSYVANSYGLYDLFGNVWEMVCQNFNFDQGYTCLDIEDDYYITKGGSWYSHPQSLKNHFRYIQSTDAYSPHVGFRIVKIVQN